MSESSLCVCASCPKSLKESILSGCLILFKFTQVPTGSAVRHYREQTEKYALKLRLNINRSKDVKVLHFLEMLGLCCTQ